MTEPTTIRERLEAIRSTPPQPVQDTYRALSEMRLHAVAALALLDNAKRHWNDAAQDTRYRYVYDPDPAPPKETDAPTAT